MNKKVILRQGEYVLKKLQKKDMQNSNIILTPEALKRFCTGYVGIILPEKNSTVRYRVRPSILEYIHIALRERVESIFEYATITDYIEVVASYANGKYVVTRISKYGEIVYNGLTRDTDKGDVIYFSFEGETNNEENQVA